MIDPLAGLRAAAKELLALEEAHRLAGLVGGAELMVAGPDERWAMGSREVSAARLALVVDPAAYVALSSDPEGLAAVRDAFARAARTPETELADLSLVVRLPGVGHGWHRAYREAALRAAPERPEPEAVLGGAAALLEARGDAAGAAALRRASLEAAEVPGAAQPLIRYVLRLDPADRAAAERDAALADRLRGAVRDAGTRALTAVSGVELATALRPPEELDDAEGRLSRALSALGAVVVPVRRDEDRVELAVIAGGELRRVEIVTSGPRARLSGLLGPHARDASLRWRVEEIPAITVAPSQVEDAAEAGAVAALLCGPV